MMQSKNSGSEIYFLARHKHLNVVTDRLSPQLLADFFLKQEVLVQTCYQSKHSPAQQASRAASSAGLPGCKASLTVSPGPAAAPELSHDLLDGKHHQTHLGLVQSGERQVQGITLRIKATAEQKSNDLRSVFLKTIPHSSLNIYLSSMMTIVPNQMMVPNELTKVDRNSNQFEETANAHSRAYSSKSNTHAVIRAWERLLSSLSLSSTIVFPFIVIYKVPPLRPGHL